MSLRHFITTKRILTLNIKYEELVKSRSVLKKYLKTNTLPADIANAISVSIRTLEGTIATIETYGLRNKGIEW